MKHQTNYPKRYKDYPPNVPRKLLKLFFDLNRSVSVLSQALEINSGYISALLLHGTEPSYKNWEVRRKLWLPSVPICKTCGRKIIIRKKSERKQSPDYIKAWNHLETAERHKVIQQYLTYKSKKLER